MKRGSRATLKRRRSGSEVVINEDCCRVKDRTWLVKRRKVKGITRGFVPWPGCYLGSVRLCR